MNTIHALDESILDLAALRKKLLRVFLHDHKLDADEREILDAFDQERDDLADYRYRQLAAQTFERNGPTRRTRDAFHEAGFEIVRLDDARERKQARTKIVQFPTNGPRTA